MSETTIVVFALAVIAVLINWKSLRDLERAGEKPWLMLGVGALLLWYIFMDDFILPVILLAAFVPWLLLRKLGKRGNRIYFTGLGIIAAITAPGNTLQFFPIRAPSMMVTFDPIHVPSPISTSW